MDHFRRLALRKMPSLDVTWSKPVQDAWYSCFKALMRLGDVDGIR